MIKQAANVSIATELFSFDFVSFGMNEIANKSWRQRAKNKSVHTNTELKWIYDGWQHWKAQQKYKNNWKNKQNSANMTAL